MSLEAQRAAQYMAEHNWLRDGVAWEQVAAVIDRENERLNPSHETLHSLCIAADPLFHERPYDEQTRILAKLGVA